jgi:SAM-dependent methyltransferase
MLSCRLCFGLGRVMLSLTPTPLANSFPDHPDQDAERYPLDLFQCHNCGHVQLADFRPVDWVDYRYATPEAMRPHLEAAADVLRRTHPAAKTVLEIGCNNGLNLEVLRQAGFRAIGVDPCTTVGIAKPFSATLARTLEPVDLIVANHVLAHVDDLHDVFNGIDHLLNEEGALVFEVQYFPELVRAGAFDMIYHEHRDYHTLAPLVPFLKRFGLVITDVAYIETRGGSLRVCCERPGLGVDVHDPDLDWRAFKARIAEAKRILLAQIAKVEGALVAFGASAKACTLIHHFGIAEFIDCCLDSTPAKEGRYIPGTKIEILSPHTHDVPSEATILLTAWNFEKEIRAQYPHHNFIVPFKEALCPVP